MSVLKNWNSVNQENLTLFLIVLSAAFFKISFS